MSIVMNERSTVSILHFPEDSWLEKGYGLEDDENRRGRNGQSLIAKWWPANMQLDTVARVLVATEVEGDVRFRSTRCAGGCDCDDGDRDGDGNNSGS
ncbi:hypothetical protein Tco_0914152 [Tanacetum coccineum]